jgi:riboflavin synthase
MFTGIVEERGVVREIRQGSDSVRLTVGALKVLEDVKIGDSISTNGICLTVVSFTHNSFTVDVMPETMRRTGFSQLTTGSGVNLERALRLHDRLGGHVVNGHIDGTGKILNRWNEGNAVWFSVAAEKELLRYIVEKGSIALDGISLTVADVDERGFRVSIIPHTHHVTTLPDKNPGDLLNIECDVMAKYLEKLIPQPKPPSKITPEFLQKNGYL